MNDDYRTVKADLWGTSRQGRLAAARALSGNELKAIRRAMRRECPSDGWPVRGFQTSINPLLVVLGPSPGNSGTGPLRPPEPPTAGEPHPRVLDGEDRAAYWDKVRYLARLVLQPPDGTERDAYASFGNATLDQDEQGDAGKVNPDRRYSRWVVRTIRDTLRPRLLVVVGLHGKLKASSDIRAVFEDELRGFRLSEPHSEHPLSCYSKKRLVFREWHCAGPNGNRIRVVLFPQHPSRSPFNILDTWYGACREFADRYRTDIDP